MSEPAPAPTGSRFALGVLVTLVVLSPWPFGSAHPLTRWLITLVCLATAIGVFLLRLRRREPVEIPPVAAIGAGFFVFGLAQLIPLPPALHSLLAPGSAAIWHPDVPAAAEVLGNGPRPISIWPGATLRAAAFGLGVIALATLAMPALRDRDRAIRAAAIVVSSALAVAVYGLIARVAFGDKLFGVLAVPTVAPFGPFVSKNHFAGYVEMGALLAIGLAFELGEESGRSRDPLGWMEGPRAGLVVLAYSAAAIMALAVLVSLSRGGALSLGAGVTAFAFMRSSALLWPSPSLRRWTLAAAGVVAVGTAALFVIPQDARNRLQSLTAGRRDAAAAYRLTVWSDSFRLVETSLLVGHGLGTFVDALPRFKTGVGDLRIEHAENDYLELLAEGGVLGAGLASLAVLALVRGARQRDRRNGTRHALVHGAAAALAAMSVHTLVDFNLRIPSNALVFVLLVGFVASASHWRGTVLLRAYPLALICALALVLLSTAGPPALSPGQRSFQAPAANPGTSLRATKLRGRICDHLQSRPADAEGWLWLAWLQMVAAGSGSDGLASYGRTLDPQRTGLAAAADRMVP